MESSVPILVVDDDRDIRTLLAEYLNANGYSTRAVADGVAMWKALKAEPFGLVVLDLMLPGDDGLALCRALRSQSALPVIMLTARGAAVDRILGLEMGADDYLAKPFEPRELLARIRSVLRRARAPVLTAKRLRFGSWILDLGARHLLSGDGVIVALSGAEYRLLKVFLDHPQGLLNRDQLLELTHGRDIEAFDRSIDLQVSRLRRRLGDDARSPQFIKTVRNEGYVFAAAVATDP